MRSSHDLTRRALLVSSATLGVLGGTRPARAANEVKIGALYPLTGGSAEVGQGDRAALEITAEMINFSHQPFPLLLGNGGGLDRLGGAQINLIFADHGGDPARARSEAKRLIVEEKVVALIGTYHSATASTVSEVAEQHEIPFLSADNSAPILHRRGLKWFFRTTPHDEMFTQAMFDLIGAAGTRTKRPARTVALFYEDSLFGLGSSAVQRKLAVEAGLTVVADVKYSANSSSLAQEAQTLRDTNADVLLPSSYTADAILLLRSLDKLGYKPHAVIAQAAGFQEQTFLSAVGPLSEGVLSRSSFASDALRFRPGILDMNEFYRARAGIDLNDNTARQVVALQVLADAINRAGSTRAEDIRAALIATDVPGDRTIMPWRGVRFDAQGQNVLATPVVQQVENGIYHTVFPSDLAIRRLNWNVS